MFAQFVPRLSVLLFILNAPLPLLQNDPKGKDDVPNGSNWFELDPTEYWLKGWEFDPNGRKWI